MHTSLTLFALLVAAFAAAAAWAGTLPPLPPLLAKADSAAGEVIARTRCGVCHSFTDGGKTGIGPNLFGVVGSRYGQKPGIIYSVGLQAREGFWTPEALNQWLANPAAYVPDTKMGFAGIGNPRQRADLIAYLCTLSPDPALSRDPAPSPDPVSSPCR